MSESKANLRRQVELLESMLRERHAAVEDLPGLVEDLREARAEVEALKTQLAVFEGMKSSMPREQLEQNAHNLIAQASYDSAVDPEKRDVNHHLKNKIADLLGIAGSLARARLVQSVSDPDNPQIGDEGFRLRDWPEDSAFEDGNYQNTCINCSRGFVGHKRRVVCRQCHIASEGT